MRETFIFPELHSLLDLPNDDQVVIVSIIGKTCFNSYGLKVKSVGRMFASSKNRNDECTIEGYYDDMNRVLYLHVHSLLDADALVEQYNLLSKTSNKNDFLSVYNKVKCSFSKAFFFLFYISHLIVLSHPGSSFDVNYVQYFKAIEGLRKDLHSSIIEILRDIAGISPEWVTNGRPCRPRMLFYFERCPKNVSNLKKLEHNIEDTIHRILKKARIVSHSSQPTLFSIPLNDEYVFVATEKPPDTLGNAVKNLIKSCTPGTMPQVKFPFSNQPDEEEHLFPVFLNVHIRIAQTKGFDDISMSRHVHQPQPHFELPFLKQWAIAAMKIYELVLEQQSVSSLYTDTRFSEQRCLKVLPLAFARYQEGLPNHYARAIHETSQSYALALFAAQARGPMFQEYSEKLISDCQKFWEAGRQLCEVASMTGNPCAKPKHSSDEDHYSGVRYVASCDCGRKTGSREDPYSAKQANFTFYHQLAQDCICSDLKRINFPIFQPSIKEYKAAILDPTEEPLSVLTDHSNELTPDTSKSPSRQPSTTEYLPGMLTLSSPPGLLPYFSSWSLVCLGPSSLYSHNLGLSENTHPGFVNSTNYLLPWDVTVYSKSKTGSNPGKQQTMRGGRRPRAANGMPLFTVKVFIGLEYECPRGHRFMLAASDRVLRAAPGSIVKDTGKDIAKSDMPLYYVCPCRSGKQRMAQLMRLHVVTPKASVYVTVDPKVQPAPGAPLFVPTTDGPTNLTQSAYWILRLPYIYATDKEHFCENSSARLLQGVFGVVKIEN